nr:hypothetical protein [Tanacetum cinerariifolium]
MYYLRFTKVIINFFMTKDPSIPRRNKVNWHYVRDDQMFTTIKHVLRHQNTQHFGAMLPVELTNEDIRNSAAYKEYYVIALRAAPPKTKASVRKTQSSSDTTMPPPTAAGIRLLTSAKGKQPAKSSKAKDDDDQEDEDEKDDGDQDDNDDDQDLDNDGDDFIHPKLSTHDEEAKDEESFDPIVQTPSQVENSNDESNDDESHGMNVGGDEGPDAEDDDEELYRDVNINLEGRDIQMTKVLITQVLEDTHVTLTSVNPNGQQQSSSVSSQFVMSMLNLSPDTGIESLFESTRRVNVPVTTTVMPLLVTTQTLPPSSIPIISQVQQAQAPSPTTAPSTSLQDLLNFGSLFGFDHRLKTSEANFSKLRDEAQAKNEDFLNKQNENIQKIIKEQVKEQVKIKSNKTIHRSDEQRNLYKGLVDSYKCDKIILDTYRDTVTLKRRRDDKDKDEEPSAGSDRGSKRRRACKEPESTKEPMQTTKYLEEPSHQEFETGAADDQPVAEASQHPEWFQKQTKPPTPDRAWNKTLPATHGSIQPWISNLAMQADSRTSFNELMDTLVDFSAFLMNRLKVDTLTPELLAGPTYELMKGSCKSLVELKFFLEEVYKATTDQLDWNNPEGQ